MSGAGSCIYNVQEVVAVNVVYVLGMENSALGNDAQMSGNRVD